MGGDSRAARWDGVGDGELGPQGRRMEGLRGLGGSFLCVVGAGLVDGGLLGVVTGGRVCSVAVGRAAVVVEGAVEVLEAPERGSGVKRAGVLAGGEVVLCFEDSFVSVFSVADGALLRSAVLPKNGGR